MIQRCDPDGRQPVGRFIGIAVVVQHPRQYSLLGLTVSFKFKRLRQVKKRGRLALTALPSISRVARVSSPRQNAALSTLSWSDNSTPRFIALITRSPLSACTTYFHSVKLSKSAASQCWISQSVPARTALFLSSGTGCDGSSTCSFVQLPLATDMTPSLQASGLRSFRESTSYHSGMAVRLS